MSRTAKDWVCVGKLAGAHGVKGDVRLKSFTADPAAIAEFSRLCQGPDGACVTLSALRPVKGGFAARLTGVESREAAQALSGTELYVPRDDLPEPDADEYYLADLEGLTAIDKDGSVIGQVKGVQNFGAGDVIELALDAPVAGYGKSVLMPFEAAFVPDVDVAAGKVVIALDAWLEGQVEVEAAL